VSLLNVSLVMTLYESKHFGVLSKEVLFCCNVMVSITTHYNGAYISAKINNRLYSSNASYHAVYNHMSSHLFKNKYKIHKTVILSVM
jgi:hypothetical protein